MAMNKTNIEYLDYTWNITHGCSPVSTGCENCWAKTTANRLAHMGQRGYSIDNPFKVICCDWKLDEPEKVRKPSRVGVSFMGDLFHEDVPDKFIDIIMYKIWEFRLHKFLILTKRIERANNYFAKFKIPIENGQFLRDFSHLWLGVTVEHPDYLWRAYKLQKIPCAVRFVSFEPLLVDVEEISNILYDYENGVFIPAIDWVIIGAESGSKRRLCKIEWVRNIVEQCKDAHVPCFVKQLHINGKVSKDMNEWPEDLRVQEYPHD